jgi:hypothetical protein
MTSHRIQLRRTKGWRKPEGAIVVARPSKWGNPCRVSDYPTWVHETDRRLMAVNDFGAFLRDAIQSPWEHPHTITFRVIAESLGELRGHDLACWCPLDQPCHADVLLELANQ